MKSIKEIVNEYGISRADLFNLLEKKTGKPYSSKTTRIWDSTFNKIKADLEKLSSKSKNSKEDDKKVLTSHDIDEVDFLASTLGISHSKSIDTEEKKVETEKNKEKSEQKHFSDKEKKEFKKDIKSKSTKDKNFKKPEKKSFTVVKKTKEERKQPVIERKETGNKIKVKKNNFKDSKVSKAEKKENKNKPVKKEERKPKVSDTLKKKDKIVIGDSISIKELSEKIGIPATEVIKKFLLNWMPVGINSSVDFDTVVLLADEFGVKVERENVKTDVNAMVEGNLKEIIEAKNSLVDESELVERPPIVTIMGHVDHGKTKLLDYIRKTDIVSKEAGGITQSIWASQITHNGKKITFIDTPWHELFTAMRARGAKITDIAVIVVAADEGVKAQTVEAINHAKDAWVSIIVAITKIDKPNANPEMCKSQMSEHGLIPEERGGDVPFIELSAVTWEWVDDLLEYILLQAEMLELKYNPKAPAVWVVLEASKDAKAWTIATLLVMTWTLRKKDSVVAYDVYGKMRLMKDWTGKVVNEAKWWDPVQVMWFEDVPQAWRIFEVFDSEKEAQKQVEKIKEIIKKTEQKTALSSFLEKMKAGENVELKLILKAGDFGGLEALKYALWKVNLPEGVELKIIHEEVGQVKDSDIALAEASGAFIFGFDSWINSSLKKKLEQKKIIFKNFTIIYELLDYVEKLAAGLIEKEQEEKYIGKLEVLAIFYKKWNDMIIGWKVIDGFIKNGSHFVLKRWEDELGGGKVTSLKIEQENVNEVKAWRECWVRVRTGKKIKEWDILEFYIYEDK